MNDPKGPLPTSPAWWEKARQKLNKLIPENLRKHPPEALRWFIDVRVLNNFHVFNKQELAEMWASGFSKLPVSQWNWTSLYDENIKRGEIHLLPLFALLLHYRPRAVEPASLDKCCVPGCETKRGESLPACKIHLCSLCGPLATEPDWQKRYYHICTTYSGDYTYGVHIISLDPLIIENLRAERERNSFYPLHLWCYGVRRECLNPMSLPSCRKDSLPTHVDNQRKMTITEQLCSICDVQSRCRHCSGRVDFEDIDRINDRVCNNSDCNTRLQCLRCNVVRFPTKRWNAKPIEPTDKLLCGTCQREAYCCLSCNRTSNDTKDIMWCNRLVWKPNDIKPDHCMRCLPSLKKLKGIPHGGGKWIQLRAIMLRLWWDRRAILSQFDKDMKERPDQLFKELTRGRMDVFATFLCHHDPENWKVLSANQAMWDSTYMLFIHLLRCPQEIFIKMLRLIC